MIADPDSGSPVVTDGGSPVGNDSGSPVGTDGGSPPSGALDLAQIDRACERMMACDLAPRLYANRTVGDCRLALGVRLLVPVVQYRRVSTGGNTTTATLTEGLDPSAERAALPCVLGASNCTAMAACLGYVPRSSVSQSFCNGSAAVVCDDPYSPTAQQYCSREDCAAQNATCSNDHGPSCTSATAATDVVCDGNVLVLNGRRIDCDASARCDVHTETPDPSSTATTATCTPTGQVCVTGLDGTSRCGGWVSTLTETGSAGSFTVPEVLLSVDRPASGGCATDGTQGAASCTNATTLRFCLGNTERTVSCTMFGGTACSSTTRRLAPEVTGYCH